LSVEKERNIGSELSSAIAELDVEAGGSSEDDASSAKAVDVKFCGPPTSR